MKQDFRCFEAMMVAEDPKNSIATASDTNAKQENEIKRRGTDYFETKLE
jgi:hypothetical protein